ncbi:MAG: hypothetical protein KDC95_22085, partial [Planctomycetes bacterium]|nr:hypothetical protein [Planctomycetota bacterium]
SIEEARAEELAGMARQFIFDQALATVYEGGRRDNEAFALAKSAAEGLGIDTASIERFDIEYRKRNSIV